MSGADVLLATVGTGRTQYDIESGLLVEALSERGLRSELVAWDAAIDWAAAALVVVRTPWDYTERHELFGEWVRATAALTRVVNDAELIAWNMHKRYLVELACAGVPVVPTAVLSRGAGDVRDALAAYEGEVVIKPAISGGARGTILVRAASEQALAHLTGLLDVGDALIQPFVNAVETAGEVSLVHFGGVFSHAVRKLAADSDFRVQEEHGGSVVAHVATPAERAVADAVLDAVAARTAYARIDVVTTDDGPQLMEAELIEPELFLASDPEAPARFAEVLAERVPASP